MNGLEIMVCFIIGLSAILGYKAGFLRVIYSLSAWIIVLVFVTWATPYITNYIEKNTAFQDTVKEKCLDYIEQSAARELGNNIEEQKEKKKELYDNPGVKLPKNVLEGITDSVTDTANDILESTGIYEKIAESIAHFIIEGIAFFAALLIAGIITKYISHVLDLVSRIPGIHGVNKMIGVAAGIVKGLLIVWLAFYMIALCSTSELGAQLLTYIEESPILLYLYNNNILLQIIMIFL